MNWKAFLSMGGYAFYVWGTYALALLALGVEILVVLRRKKASRSHSHQLTLRTWS